MRTHAPVSIASIASIAALICTASVATRSLVACKEDQPQPNPAGAASTKQTASVVAASVAASASTPPPATAASPVIAASASGSGSASGHAPTCEVEVFGKVNVPKTLAPKTRVVVYVAQDDCLSPNAHILGHIPAAPTGEFVIEVFPKWGTDVTICAGVDPEGGKPSEMYGKAKGPFHAEGEGEVTFTDVKIDLAAGKPLKFGADSK